jgi:hypothetical protein
MSAGSQSEFHRELKQLTGFHASQFKVEVTYTVDQYLMLLSTYSPYVKLEAQQKQTLFARLREVLEQNGTTIQLSYVSAFHIVRPN